MTEYNIHNVNGHILIESCGDMLLVDTGSPMSFHENGRMTLCGQTFNVPRSLMNVDAGYASRQVGAPVKGFVGMDFISAHPMSIDVERGVLAFDCDTAGWEPVRTFPLPGAVCIELEVGGTPAKVILDTGAPVSYISQEFTSGCNPVGTVTDFSPFHAGDTFETPVYDLPCSLAEHDFRMQFGNLPKGLSVMVSLLGADGAVGMDLLRHVRILMADGKAFVSK